MSFGTCLNCMDGRYQLPILTWIRDHYGLEYVDMITQAGMDGLLADPDFDLTRILERIDISLQKHHSERIFIVGHHDCAGNQVDDATHQKQVLAGVERIKSLRPQAQVIGLWCRSPLEVEKIVEK